METPAGRGCARTGSCAPPSAACSDVERARRLRGRALLGATLLERLLRRLLAGLLRLLLTFHAGSLAATGPIGQAERGAAPDASLSRAFGRARSGSGRRASSTRA